MTRKGFVGVSSTGTGFGMGARMGGSPGDVPGFDPTRRTLRVALGKGDRALLRISAKLPKDALHELMGVWQWVSSATAELERQALDGQHWMLTPWHTVELVHAVQRPLRDPEFTTLVIGRSTRETSAQPRFRAKVSIKSTDRLDLLAEWHEPDDREPGEQVDHHRGDTAFSLKVTAPGDYEAESDANPRGGVPDHRISGVDEIDVGLEWRGSKRHEFHDTRYRRIEYRLQATTKFREYLPANLADDEDKLRVLGAKRVTWIPSSAPPPAPEVLYVVPTFVQFSRDSMLRSSRPEQFRFAALFCRRSESSNPQLVRLRASGLPGFQFCRNDKEERAEGPGQGRSAAPATTARATR